MGFGKDGSARFRGASSSRDMAVVSTAVADDGRIAVLFVVGSNDYADAYCSGRPRSTYRLVMLAQDGSRDAGFGDDGVVNALGVKYAPPQQETSYGAGDGAKITFDSQGRLLTEVHSATATHSVISRFTSDGELDPNFAGGGRLKLSGIAYEFGVDPLDRPTFLLADDSITCDHQEIEGSRKSLRRLTVSGARDPSFANAGVFSFKSLLSPKGSRSTHNWKLISAPGGGYFFVGETVWPRDVVPADYSGPPLKRTYKTPSIVKVTDAGQLDPTFGVGGTLPNLAAALMGRAPMLNGSIASVDGSGNLYLLAESMAGKNHVAELLKFNAGGGLDWRSDLSPFTRRYDDWRILKADVDHQVLMRIGEKKSRVMFADVTGGVGLFRSYGPVHPIYDLDVVESRTGTYPDPRSDAPLPMYGSVGVGDDDHWVTFSAFHRLDLRTFRY